MSMRVSWHPTGHAYHARADESGGCFWVELCDGSGDDRRECTFFFPTQAQARAVAAAFNDGPPTQTNGDPDGPHD